MNGSEERDLAERFRHIAEIDGGVAWMLAWPGGQLSYVSPAVETLLGYSAAEVARQFGGAGAEGLAGLRAGLPERLRRLGAGDRTRQRLVRHCEQRHKDGRMVTLEVISTVLVDADGAATAVVGVARDIGAQIKAAAKAAEQQRRFASMLNHEFRTPLSTIDGAIQRLEATSAHADAATRERYRKIAAAVDRLVGMLDEYLTPARMEDCGGRRRGDTLAPRALLEEGARQARDAGRVALVCAGDLPPALRCDPDGLRLALKVLVDNAIAYTPPECVITLSGRRADGGIELVVEDDGPGVPHDDTTRIFDKSARGSNAGAHPGSGLGLYMARSIVDVHGGSLSMRHAAPRGAVFRIWLPAQGGAGKSVAPGDPSSDNQSDNQLAVGPTRTKG